VHAGIKAKTYLFRGEKSMKWSWPDSPGGAALAPAYRFCMPGKPRATPAKYRALSKFFPVSLSLKKKYQPTTRNKTTRISCSG
ncbi:hypothetical protein ACVGWW_01345, partial [Enterobacter hormaechei]